jgi:hypothetical protein
MELEIYSHLNNLLNENDLIRKESENYFITKEKENSFKLINDLLLITKNENQNINNNIIQMIYILIKNYLLKENNYLNFSNEKQEYLLNFLINFIDTSNNENKIKQCCLIISTLIYNEFEYEKNKTKILTKIINKLSSKRFFSYLFIIKEFLENNNDNEKRLIDINIVNKLLNKIFEIFKNRNEFNDDISIIILDLLYDLISYLKFSFLINTKEILNKLFDNIFIEKKYLNKNLKIIYEIIDLFHLNIAEYFLIIFNYLINVNDNFILEIFYLIIRKEIENKTNITNILKNNINLFLNYLDNLKYDENKDFEIFNEENFNDKKIILYLLKYLNENILYLKYIENNFNNIDENKQISSILLLNIVIENEEITNNFLKNNIKNIFNKIKLNNYYSIKNFILSYVLVKISFINIKLFDVVFINDNMPKIIEIIINENYEINFRINFCFLLKNIILYFKERIINNFLYKFIDEIIKNKNKNISFCLTNLLQISFEYLNNVSLELFLNKILTFNENIINNNNNYNKEYLEEIIENLSFLICQIFNQLINIIKIENCKKIYYLIMKNFKFLGKYYESGLLTLLNIIILLNDEDDVNFDDFFNSMNIILYNALDYSKNIINLYLLLISNLLFIKSKLLYKYINDVKTSLEKIDNINDYDINIKKKVKSILNDMNNINNN